MSIHWHFRPACADDLRALSKLLPAVELETAGFLDAQSNDLLLVAVAGRTGTDIQGCIRVRRRIGMEQPRYWYHLGCVVLAAAELGLFQREQTLLLGNDHTGATELADLQIDRDALAPPAQLLLTRYLVRAALCLLQRDDATLQPDRIIAAVPGVQIGGTSPFWEGFGRHFFPGDVAQSLARFGSQWYTHVAALLPRHPIVTSLLHANAQAAIGGIASDAHPLRDALTASGLRPGQHVSLYDAGPVYETTLSELNAGHPLQQLPVRPSSELNNPQTYLILNPSEPSLWLVQAEMQADGRLAISPDCRLQTALADATTVWVG